MRTAAEVESEIRALASADGYRLNPDAEIREGIIEGIAANEEALGYWNCPCRMSSGDRMADFGIICPCEYRDADLAEYGRCYCALYVTQGYIDRGLPPDPIPERRPGERTAMAGRMAGQPIEATFKVDMGSKKNIAMWRCQVCGYLCARAEAPPVCPICRAKKEKFEEFNP